MKARLSNELHNAIHEKIILDLTIHYLNGKLEKEQDRKKLDFLNKIIYRVSQDRRNNSVFLKDNGIKVFEPVPDDDGLFITYTYSQSINGGFKEGQSRYWRAALKNHLRNKLEDYYRGNGEVH